MLALRNLNPSDWYSHTKFPKKKKMPEGRVANIMAGKFPKPCLECGALTNGESRCETHHKIYLQDRATRPGNLARRMKKAKLYNSRYQAQSKQIRATATHCYLCGDAATPSDPIEADHLYPSLADASPLAGAHRSCNNKKAGRDVSDLDPSEWPGLRRLGRLDPPAGKLGG